MTKSPYHCQDAFNTGTADRATYPLHSGIYKLRDARNNLNRCADTVANISAYQREGPDAGRGWFGCCTHEDADVWLKSLPEVLAHELGYNVMPAIRALAGDGVPADKVAGCLHRAQGKVDGLVPLCDTARGWLAPSIDREYRRMKNHDSMLEPLIVHAMEVVDEALRTAEAEALVV